MPWDPDIQYNNQIYNNPYNPNGYKNARLRKLVLIIVGIFVIIILAILIFHHASQPKSQQSKQLISATAAAKKKTPDAKVSNLKVAGGFAIASVSDPSAQGQANSGYETIFKVNKDGSMVQIASGSAFGPLDLLQLGIPLLTQAKLLSTSLTTVEQNLASQCDYSEGAIGFLGFDGSFNPGGWEIDAGTLSTLEQKLSSVIDTQNVSANPGKQVICVNVTQNNSNKTINSTTYTSTFTLQIQFITSDGTLTTHTLTFAIGFNNYHTYTLDGQNI